MDDPRLTLRPATPADAEAILRILDATYEFTWKPQLTAEARARFEAQRRTPAYVREHLAHFQLACRDDQVIGLVDWRDDFIDALHVSPHAQRTGAGGALLRHAERRIAADGYRQVRLETDTFNVQSRAFYAAHGYAEIDFYPDEEWHSGFTTVLLSKPLN
ncbi:GNAT family N-acetyltransferase [Pseudomonas citronellolis]|uniref:GNAT family N-acetyltransferase n=1 Tax=Pseudomonas citronellolis TaxID=53408 RepID=UPI0023E40B19|nr:GNAT family N-acetyltransferase [Pseudomonas citronellolis]MDF3935470.1 GNAT family N-acetyltransferase [Pseudomonas citronellolis]